MTGNRHIYSTLLSTIISVFKRFSQNSKSKMEESEILGHSRKELTKLEKLKSGSADDEATITSLWQHFTATFVLKCILKSGTRCSNLSEELYTQNPECEFNPL